MSPFKKKKNFQPYFLQYSEVNKRFQILIKDHVFCSTISSPFSFAFSTFLQQDLFPFLRSNKVLVADLGKMTISNKFCLTTQEEADKCLLDVMDINLINMDLCSGQRMAAFADSSLPDSAQIRIGNTVVEKVGGSYLGEKKCQLQLRVERNLDSLTAHPVPDISIQGTLSALHANIGLEQFQLLKGLLMYNIGENLDDLDYLLSPIPIIKVIFLL
jgi:hypothetical protein